MKRIDISSTVYEILSKRAKKVRKRPEVLLEEIIITQSYQWK